MKHEVCCFCLVKSLSIWGLSARKRLQNCEQSRTVLFLYCILVQVSESEHGALLNWVSYLSFVIENINVSPVIVPGVAKYSKIRL